MRTLLHLLYFNTRPRALSVDPVSNRMSPDAIGSYKISTSLEYHPHKLITPFYSHTEAWSVTIKLRMDKAKISQTNIELLNIFQEETIIHNA